MELAQATIEVGNIGFCFATVKADRIGWEAAKKDGVGIR